MLIETPWFILKVFLLGSLEGCFCMLGCLEGDNGFSKRYSMYMETVRVCLVGDVLGILIPW